jgi:ATP-dependent DNA helicase DinG
LRASIAHLLDSIQWGDAPTWLGVGQDTPETGNQGSFLLVSGILYVARHLPQPGRDGQPPEYLDEIAAATAS